VALTLAGYRRTYADSSDRRGALRRGRRCLHRADRARGRSDRNGTPWDGPCARTCATRCNKRPARCRLPRGARTVIRATRRGPAPSLALPLSDPDGSDVVVHPDLEHKFPSHGNGLIGFDTTQPEVVVAANGGSDLIYLPQPAAAALAPKIVAFLLAQDYVSGVFVDARLGRFGGRTSSAGTSIPRPCRTPTSASRSRASSAYSFRQRAGSSDVRSEKRWRAARCRP